MAQALPGLQLQRSAVSFRRQGSSGLVWEDRFLSGELTRPNRADPLFLSGELTRPNRAQSQRPHRPHHHHGNDRTADVVNTAEVKIRSIRTVRSNDTRPGHQDPAEPVSPRLTGCGCCGGLVKSPRSARTFRQVKSRPR